MPAATPPVMKAVPPPLMVATAVAVLAAAASGCDASIGTASEMAGTRLRSFLIMSLFPPVIASECSALRARSPSPLYGRSRASNGVFSLNRETSRPVGHHLRVWITRLDRPTLQTNGGFAAHCAPKQSGCNGAPSSPAPKREQAVPA